MKEFKKLKTTDVSKMSETEWQASRKEFVNKGMIGGSDAGVLLGLSKYKSPINLFYQAVGLSNLPNLMNPAMMMGKLLEKQIADIWQFYDDTPEGWVQNMQDKNKIRKYRQFKQIIENPKYPALFSNIDGIITSHPVYKKKKGILEIKTISGYSADSWESGIPPSYYAQVQTYMLVCEMDYAEIFALKDGREVSCLTIEADHEIQESILHEANAFQARVHEARSIIQEYTAHTVGYETEDLYGVVAHLEPPADDSDAFNKFVSERHKAREEEVVMQGNDALQAIAEDYVATSAVLKEIETKKQLYQNQLKQVMEQNGASVMMLPEGKISWRKMFTIKLNK
jgi:putative phage-type endonuclease